MRGYCHCPHPHPQTFSLKGEGSIKERSVKVYLIVIEGFRHATASGDTCSDRTRGNYLLENTFKLMAASEK
jgi:hypothetical protein